MVLRFSSCGHSVDTGVPQGGLFRPAAPRDRLEGKERSTLNNREEWPGSKVTSDTRYFRSEVTFSVMIKNWIFSIW